MSEDLKALEKRLADLEAREKANTPGSEGWLQRPSNIAEIEASRAAEVEVEVTSTTVTPPWGVTP